MQIKKVGWIREGIIMCKLNVRMEKGGHYECGNERVDEQGAHYDVEIKRVDGLREGIMMCK